MFDFYWFIYGRIFVLYHRGIDCTGQYHQYCKKSYLESEQIEITAKDLTDRQLDILLKIEDPNFYNHHGVDFKTPGAGWTTITQGLAKKFYFRNFEQGLMKIKQTLCARLALDPLVSKETQLTIYLNIMYFENGIYGLHDAANYYYGKNVPVLEEEEYIALIASLIDPNGLNIEQHPQENYQRVQRIKKVLSGAYIPQGLFDITYEGADNIVCEGGLLFNERPIRKICL